ncbi:MAG TPA: divalent metal cation transporter [Nitrososphaeraceae archaeon]|nr:divalent metal cation transporter [Nitrososphaeraceae archaeon]
MFSRRFRNLGPGIITGAADDDPSGIATYSQAGAQFGLGLAWTPIFFLPLLFAIQEICARIGLVSGTGIISLMKKKYPKKLIYPLISLLAIANTINLGADLNAIGASANLIIPGIPIFFYTLFFTLFILITEIFVSYIRYVRILKYLTLSLLCYFITAIIVGGNWNQIFLSTITPNIEFNKEFIMMFVALCGTTLSPYLFFWQTSEEAEEDVVHKKIKEIGKGKPKISKQDIKAMRKDIFVGMAFSVFIMWSIIVTAAGSLNLHGITNIQTADQAAQALEPLVQTFPNSGFIAKIIFAIGIIGTGLLAIPVLASSTAYAFSDTFGWTEGLSKKFKQAKSFYLTIVISTIIGLFFNFSGIEPIKALIYAAIINGVISIPILVIIMKISNDKKLLGQNVNGKISNTIGVLTMVIMTIPVIFMILTSI